MRESSLISEPIILFVSIFFFLVALCFLFGSWIKRRLDDAIGPIFILLITIPILVYDFQLLISRHVIERFVENSVDFSIFNENNTNYPASGFAITDKWRVCYHGKFVEASGFKDHNQPDHIEFFESSGLFEESFSVSEIHTLIVISPFIAKTFDIGSYVTIHKDPLTGRELSRSAPYGRNINTFGMRVWVYDLQTNRIIGFKRFEDDNRWKVYEWVAGLRARK